MAGFKTHITVSSTLGVAYGAAGVLYGDMPSGVAALATGLCGASGMLPDLDSDSGVPLRESLAFTAAIAPMLMIPRFRSLGLSPEWMVLAGAGVYLSVRFGLGALLKKYTVHRGMFHSLPAALIAAEIAFLVYARKDITLRYFVSGGVLLGFMSHLVLDEIWSFTVVRGRITVKKSFGTAMKLWSDSLWANVSCYAKLILLSIAVFHDPVWMYNAPPSTQGLRMIADRFMGRFKKEVVDDLKELQANPRLQEDQPPTMRTVEPDDLRPVPPRLSPRPYRQPYRYDEPEYRNNRAYDDRTYDNRSYRQEPGPYEYRSQRYGYPRR